MVLELPAVDTSLEKRARVNATKFPPSLHLLPQVTMRLQASYPLSSVRMLTNSALFSLTLSESDYDNRVRTSCGVAQLMLADRASNPDEP